MLVKKEYAVGDTVWIYGITRGNTKPVKGSVIKIIDLQDAGWKFGPHYIIEVSSHIEPILEIRTWETMSQDEIGPVGCLRELKNIDSTIKFAGTVGFSFDDTPELETFEDDPSPEQIMAALENSKKHVVHQPLIIKETRTKRKPYNRKKRT